VGNPLWTRQFGTSSTDIAWGVSADSSAIYVAGETCETLPGQVSSGGCGAFVRKYDASGAEQWTRPVGSSDFDFAYAVKTDGTGIYVAGLTGGALPGQTSSGNQDAFVRKYDSSGNAVWTRQFGSFEPASDAAFAVDSDGNAYVAGVIPGALPGKTSAGFSDAFVRKYDPNGNELWTSQFGTNSFDEVHGILVDSSGIYVAGYTCGTFAGETAQGGCD